MNRWKKTIGIILVLSLLLALFFVLPAGKTGNVYASLNDGKALGIDVSNHNGTIDWAKAKAGGVEFAIIRIGWGDDYPSQDDSKAVFNMQQCERYGIPYGVYIYSYAISTAEVDSEIAHTLRMLKGHYPSLGVWFDMEDADFYKEWNNFNPATHGKQLTEFCLRYLRGIKAKGYPIVGVYASRDYFRYILDYNKLKAEGLIWLAHWGIESPSMDCAMWQYSEKGTIAGGKGVFDMNYIYAGSPLFTIVAGVPSAVEEFSRPSGAPILYGDIDGDGNITLKDLSILKKAVLGKVRLVGNAKICGDVNRDNQMTLSDLTLTKQHILRTLELNDSKEESRSTNSEAAQQIYTGEQTTEPAEEEQTEAETSEITEDAAAGAADGGEEALETEENTERTTEQIPDGA